MYFLGKTFPRDSVPSNLGIATWIALCASLFAHTDRARAAEIGEQVKRIGDEIMVCGQMFHTTAPVVLWTDAQGYDTYRVERRFSDLEKASWEETIKEAASLNSPNRYSVRQDRFTTKQLE